LSAIGFGFCEHLMVEAYRGSGMGEEAELTGRWGQDFRLYAKCNRLNRDVTHADVS
jgi:hypothetical protein